VRYGMTEAPSGGMWKSLPRNEGGRGRGYAPISLNQHILYIFYNNLKCNLVKKLFIEKTISSMK